MPWLYLKGVSTGDYQEALSSLLGAKLAVGDGALGFWKALSKPYPDTRHQRCWIQKTVNILNTLSKSAQHKVKTALHEIWISETHDGAYKAFDRALVRFVGRSIMVRWNACARTEMSCKHSTISLPNTGAIFGRPIQ